MLYTFLHAERASLILFSNDYQCVKNQYESYLLGIKSSLNDEKTKEKLEEEDIKKLNEAIENGQTWFDAHPTEEHDVYDTKFKELQDLCMPIMMKLHTPADGQQMSGGMPGGMPDMSSFTNNESSPEQNDTKGPSIEEVD